MIGTLIAVAACVIAVATFIKQVRFERAYNAALELDAALTAKFLNGDITEEEQLLLWELQLMFAEES